MAMSNHHREMLRKNRVELVQNVIVNQDMLSTLRTDNTITEDMEEEIMHEKTRSARVGKLLDILVRRGAKAFENLIHALVESHHDDYANLLDAALCAKYKTKLEREEMGMDVDVMDYMADVGESDKEIAEKLTKSNDMSVCVKPMGVRALSDMRRRTDVYPMTRQPRGLAVIISNQYFVKGEPRHGTTVDAVQLEKLFTGLGFEVVLFENLSSEDMCKELMSISARPEHSAANAFALFVLSHGKCGTVLGSDNQEVSIMEKVVSCFDGKHCAALIGKPKLFFFQACQGELVTAGSSASASQVHAQATSDVDHIDGPTSHVPDHPDAHPEPAPAPRQVSAVIDRIHEKADMLIAFASTEGYKAWRNENAGSWYVQAIVYIFSNYADKMDITKLLTLVCAVVSHFRTDKGMIQLPDYRPTMTKSFYFMPEQLNA